MAIVKWHDNRLVTLISSHTTVEPQDKAHRRSKQEKAFLDVNQPHIVKEYNTFMGWVDLNDGCITRYKYNMRSRRWCIYLFWHSIMLALVNSWLTYCCDCKLLGDRPLNQRRFQAEVATSLILYYLTDTPYLDQQLPKESVSKFLMMFVWTRLHTSL